MAFKTITIKSDVYEKLISIKRQDESFSELFDRLSQRNLEILETLRGCTEFESKSSMIDDIYKRRRERRY